TTGRHVRPRTRRVATARIVSLLNRTIRRPPRIRSRPTMMKMVMSAVAVLKNFHGLRSHASMRTPADVKTVRGPHDEAHLPANRLHIGGSPHAREPNGQGGRSCVLKN